MTLPTTTGPTAYPAGWRPKGAPPPGSPPHAEAVAMAVDAYVAALSDEEFDALVARTRNGGQPAQYTAPNQYNQPPIQPTQYGR